MHVFTTVNSGEWWWWCVARTQAVGVEWIREGLLKEVKEQRERE
jgi:hypothetical protein